MYIIRPLLDCGRSLIERYASENNLTYCTDKSNFESRYSRNKIRNKVMPLLEEINPAAVKNLNEDIGRFRQMNRVFDRLIKKEIEALTAEKSDLEAKLSGGLTDMAELQAASSRFSTVSEKLDSLETRWLELSI